KRRKEKGERKKERGEWMSLPRRAGGWVSDKQIRLQSERKIALVSLLNTHYSLPVVNRDS
ncbi:MAG TPA: hypothetical protein PKN40_07260, partial [Chitinophagales bacterium]|nr:hypothetical protein [Chitinophagales bacterium]